MFKFYHNYVFLQYSFLTLKAWLIVEGLIRAGRSRTAERLQALRSRVAVHRKM